MGFYWKEKRPRIFVWCGLLTDASKHLASNLTSSIHPEEAFPVQPPSLFWPLYSLVSSLSEFVILAKLLQCNGIVWLKNPYSCSAYSNFILSCWVQIWLGNFFFCRPTTYVSKQQFKAKLNGHHLLLKSMHIGIHSQKTPWNNGGENLLRKKKLEGFLE